MRRMGNEKRIGKIRARKSYQAFKQYLEEAGRIGIRMPSEEDFLMFIHSMIDKRNGFHTETKSYFAKESIGQLCKDINNGIVEIGE